ncbi:HWE histidine kinase domain-containing protein [Blastomonas sp. AAP53]|uniref:sensor histidine kinase n=1 Tax=Blastomonas sp. AAP53 TaxID=1248760 RepID=UPI00187BF766|nr:HWE histidine kinase domain-containing protein [Blastomonas sp. AAP53]
MSSRPDTVGWSGPVQTLNQFIATLPLLVWRAERSGGWIWASPQWQAFTGQGEADYLGDGWLDVVHPDDREAAQTAWRAAPDRRSFEVEFRVHNVAQDRYVWHKTRAGPVFGDDGRILEWLGTSTDIDDLKRLRDQERSLLGELQHRVRNMLGVVRALSRRTADHSATIDEFVRKFDGRLNSFSRTQSLSTSSATGQVNLADLVFDELLLHQLQDERQVQADGPDILLGVKAANLVGLAIHELASHAVSFADDPEVPPRLTVRWGIDDSGASPVLTFLWKEEGRALVDPDAALNALARDFVERALQYEVDAETRIDSLPSGLVFDLRLPLARAQETDS